MWQYLKREEKGKLLYKILKKGVVNIAKYYHHKTVCVGGQDNNIFNICKGLNITKATNYKLKGLIMPPKLTKMQGSIKKDWNFNKKKSSSCSALLPPNKCLCLTSLTKRPIIQNRVYWRVITSDYRKPLYKASFWAAILTTLKGYIKGYKSLYIQASVI